MPSAGALRSQFSPQAVPGRVWRTLSIIAAVIAVILSLIVFGAKLKQFEVSPLLLLVLLVAICTVIFVHGRFLLHLHRQHRQTAGALIASEQEFQQMADNIQEIFWMLDARTRNTIYVNQAYETITGRSCRSLQTDPMSYEEAIHPEDRSHVLGRLREATQSGQFDERFRIVRPDGEIRWLAVRGFPVRDFDGRISRLVGTAQEITAQKHAEDQVIKNLTLAENAWAESEALRKATLALTQDLRMDFVLDALLESLTDLISCDCARIWLLEGDTRLFAAREKVPRETSKKCPTYPLTLDAAEIPFMQRILGISQAVLLPDTKQDPDWPTFTGHTHLRSWLCVPLIASRRTLGLLSLGHTQPDSFTREDLRRAQLLAIPAAVAIQNSRLYECASIYGSELERRIQDLHAAKKALEQAEESRKVSEDKFRRIFSLSPVALSITTVGEGCFLDVNAAFERLYGYSRCDLIGHTLHDLQLWNNPGDRDHMLGQLQKGNPIRDVIAPMRTKSGEIKITTVCADRIQFDGQACVLSVSEDLPQHNQRLTN